MIPKKLKIKGLYSYQQELQEIDFETLTSAHLFGIFGSVGSGKSSILEAVSFALYGQTDRLNKSGDNRNYNMMNLKSDALFIEFQFEAAGRLFMVTVSGKRNRKRFQEVKKLDRIAYRFEEGEWVPVEIQVLHDAVGLNYENFKRTVIIPQGRFQEFLQLSDKERTQMMKELFHLQRFELAPRVSSLIHRNKESLSWIHGQLQQLDQPSVEQLADFKEQQQVLQNNRVILEKDQKVQRSERDRLQRIRSTFLKIASYQEQYAVLKAREKAVLAQEAQLKTYVSCQQQFAAPLQNKREQSQELLNCQQQLHNHKVELENERPRLISQQKQMELAQAAFDQKELWLKQADELEQLVEVISLQQQLKKLLVREQDGTAYLDQMTKTLEANELLLTEQQKHLIERKAVSPDKAKLVAIQAWVQQRDYLDGQMKQLEVECMELERDRKIQQNEIVVLANSLQLQADRSVANLSAKIEEQLLQQEKADRQLAEQQASLQVQMRLQTYARNLVAGEPCPLCGAVSHPQVLQAGDLAAAQSGIEAQTLLHNKMRLKLEEGLRQLKEITLRIKVLDESIAKQHRAKNRQREQIGDHALVKTDLGVDKDITAEQIMQQIVAADAQLLAEKELEFAVEELRQKRDSDRRKLEQYQSGWQKIRDNSMQLRTQIQTLQKQLSTSAQEQTDCEAEVLKTKMNALREQASVAEANFQKAREAEQQLVQLVVRREAAIEALTNQETTLNERIQQIEKKLIAAIEKSGFEHLSEVEVVLEQALDTEKLSAEVEAFHREFGTLKAVLLELEAEAKGQMFDEDAFAALEKTLMELEQKLNAITRQEGVLITEIRSLENRLKQATSLEKEQAELELRAEDLETLSRLFRASGFVNYVSTVYLRNLCAAANERFYQLTRKKLKLELMDDNAFQVRDFLNEGKLRSVKTLSGGQTFQASLSLALALADNIRSANGAGHNFFFLDEGFGSLDKEALQVVFETLKSLRHEDRVVGVISHVEEMQQEIDTHLLVINDPQTGSHILPSWE